MKALTLWFVALCLLLFTVDAMTNQKGPAFSPLRGLFFFDYPSSLQRLHAFMKEHALKGMEMVDEQPQAVQEEFYALCKECDSSFTLEKVRHGQVWRLVTPILLHKDLIHLLGNMGWFYVLGTRIEGRLRRGRFLFLCLFLAIGSNLVQHLVDGPYFLGCSGVVAGFLGFLLRRRIKDPSEGGDLSPMQIMFLGFFLFGPTLLGYRGVAHAAHIAGGALGFLVGGCSFFALRRSSI